MCQVEISIQTPKYDPNSKFWSEIESKFCSEIKNFDQKSNQNFVQKSKFRSETKISTSQNQNFYFSSKEGVLLDLR